VEDTSNDKPFDDEPFDAGVEADEESDPKKFIEQLTGKLGQSLRKYNDEQGAPDFELEKFAINSLLSATHTSQMDSEDQKDIIKKVKTSGRGDETAPDEETPTDTSDEVETDTETTDTGDETEVDDSENMFETEMLGEMSLTDFRSKALIDLYDKSYDAKKALTRLVSSSKMLNDADKNKKRFLKDLQERFNYKEIIELISELEKMGFKVYEKESKPSFMEEADLFLKNPKKNNMFQEGSNDILNEKDPCWKGYKQYGMKTKNGKEVPNCVKVDESYLVKLEEKLKTLLANKQVK